MIHLEKWNDFWNKIIFQLASLQHDARISNVKPTKLNIVEIKNCSFCTQKRSNCLYNDHTRAIWWKKFWNRFHCIFYLLCTFFGLYQFMRETSRFSKKKWKNGAFTSHRHFHCSHLFKWWESIPLCFDPTFHFPNAVCHGKESEKPSDSRVINIWAKHVSTAKTWRKHKLIVDNMDHERRTEIFLGLENECVCRCFA